MKSEPSGKALLIIFIAWLLFMCILAYYAPVIK